MRFDFRRVGTDDLATIAEWLGRPHVAEWFPGTETQVASIRAHLGDDWMRLMIVTLEGKALGYLQCYEAARDPLGSWADQPAGTRGIDQFIADADMVGRGYGTGFIRQFADELFATGAVPRMITDPDPRNARAIRCYEKAGFRAMGPVEKPWGRTLLMVRDAPPSASGARASP